MATRVGVVGLRSAAVPMRRRGWLDLARIDPAFALAAAALTDPEERGFARPLLLTVDEVVHRRRGRRPAELALRERRHRAVRRDAPVPRVS